MVPAVDTDQPGAALTLREVNVLAQAEAEQPATCIRYKAPPPPPPPFSDPLQYPCISLNPAFSHNAPLTHHHTTQTHHACTVAYAAYQ